MKISFALLFMSLIFGATAATFDKIDASKLNSTTLKDFYLEVEKLQLLSPSNKKFDLFLRAVDVDKTYGLSEERIAAQMTAWPFNWLVNEEMVTVEKASRKDNGDVILSGLLDDSHFFVSKKFYSKVDDFVARLAVKLGRNGNLRLYATYFDHNDLEVIGWILYNKGSQEALLVLVIDS